MKIDYDKNKSEKNSIERNLPFEQAINFEWETAILMEDTRKAYSERRFVAAGFLHKRLHILCFSRISGGIRVISFRKANTREVNRYEKTKTLSE